MSQGSEETIDPREENVSKHDLSQFYQKICLTLAKQRESPPPPQNASPSSTFLRDYPSAWLPFDLKDPQTVLLQRLEYIWNKSGNDSTEATTTNLLSLTPSSTSVLIQNALAAIKVGARLPTRGQWINAILSIHGPKRHSVLKQLIDPSPFKDESWLDFATRLNVLNERIDAHPIKGSTLNERILPRKSC